MSVFITVDKRSADGAIQISINDDDGGYRIAGPKYNGSGKTLLKHVLTQGDKKTIMEYLKQIPTQPRVGPVNDKDF